MFTKKNTHFDLGYEITPNSFAGDNLDTWGESLNAHRVELLLYLTKEIIGTQ